MKHSVLPIYHLALLRGTLLQVKADQEVLESLDALYHMAVKARATAMVDEEPELMVKPSFNMNIIHETNIPAPQDRDPEGWSDDLLKEHGYLSVLRSGEDANEAQEVKSSISKKEVDLYISPLDYAANQQALNMELSEEEARRKFPTFTHKILDGGVLEVTGVGMGTPEPYKPLQTELPPEIKTSENWTEISLLFLFNEREKTPPTKWKDIGAHLGKKGEVVQMKYIKLLRAGDIDLIRKHVPIGGHPEFELEETVATMPPIPYQGANTAIAAKHMDSYAGKRDDKTLHDTDWPDIRHRFHGLGHLLSAIAKDYNVDGNELFIFIKEHDKKEAELSEKRLGENQGKML